MYTIRLFTRLAILVTGLAVTVTLPARAAEDTPPKTEAELVAILQSDAPPADKAIACKQLAIKGTGAAVSELAQLLPDEQLSSWARIALEAIPGTEADEALREASGALQGRLLIGTLNSIGVRKDAGAVELLTARLQDPDAEVASAAAVALGQIANPPATEALRGALASSRPAVRSAVAEGCVLCAERLVAEGKTADAAEIYDEVRKADVPKQRQLEATRGVILARGAQGIPILQEQFRSEDKAFFQIALSTAREFPGKEVDQVLADELGGATPERAALLIQAMADRPQSVVLAAVLKAAQEGPQQVRISALGALARVGDASCLPALIEIAKASDAELAQVAKATLAELPGEAVNTKILERLFSAPGKADPLLIELVGKRRIDAYPLLAQALGNSDRTVRTAALAALGETITLDRLNVLISQVVSPTHPEDATLAQQALQAASIRMPDREACATKLALALDHAPGVETKSSLLQILGAVGGSKALDTVAKASRGSDPQLQDLGSRLLGEWMTADAGPVLLDLASTAPDERFRTRALRGYIRIARQFDLPIEERVEMCQKALEVAQQLGDPRAVLENQRRVLDVLAIDRYASIETLKAAIEAMQNPALKEDATQTALTVARRVRRRSDEVKKLLAEAPFDKVKLEIVKAEYGSGSTQQDVTAVLRKHVSDLPIINLPSGYNEIFGGDPLPGSQKQLKVQYKIDGKSGEATFNEDALIVLPTT